MSPTNLVQAAAFAGATYLCLLGPGHAWLRGRPSFMPRGLAVLALSAAWTTLVATFLAAAGGFSLLALATINAVVCAGGYLAARLGPQAPLAVTSSEQPGPGYAGMALALCALLAYWPPHATFFGAGDSSAYLASGIHLARKGSLVVHDELGPQVPATVRRLIFRSADPGHWRGPFSRSPGALGVNVRGAEFARPFFFPVPSVWSALAVATLGPLHAAAYAPLFAALALWAVWAFARQRLSVPAALLVAALVAANAASYWSGRFALAEPPATFFFWSGMAALGAWQVRGHSTDAALAGTLLGTAVFARAEFALFIGGALLAAGPALRGERRSMIAFYLCLALLAIATVAEALLIQGTYVAPIGYALRAFRWVIPVLFDRYPAAVCIASAAAITATLAATKRFGAITVARVGLVLGMFGGYFLTSNFLGGRSLMWLSMYLGWPTLAAAIAGIWLLWRERRADGLVFLALFSTAAVLLLYNPHVYPYLPWAARRFVPVMIPSIALLAAACVDRLWFRSRSAAAVLVVLVLWGILPAGRPVWGRRFFEGSAAQLEALSKRLPKDGVLLIGVELNSYMLGPALWMIYGRNNLPVHPEWLPAGRREIAAMVHTFGKQGPVYLLTPTIAEKPPIPGVSSELVGSFELTQRLLEQSHYRPPARSELQYTSLSLQRLSPAPAAPPPSPAKKPHAAGTPR